MLRLLSEITITQQPSDSYPSRNKVFVLNFCNDIEIYSTWQNLTDTCKIIIPKKVLVVDDKGNKVNWFGQNTIGSNTTSPLILRGDKILIRLGYNYPTPTNPEVIELNTEFDGYVSEVNPKMPITLMCEDRMWVLKQIKVPNKVYSNLIYSVQDMIQEMLLQQDSTKDIILVTGSSIGEKIETNINAEFRTQDDTIGSVLTRLRKEARLYSYFRGNELRCSGIVYYPSDRVVRNFAFQKNIISDNLIFKRVEDIKLGANCYSLNKVNAGGTNKNGSPKIRQKRLSTFVGEKEGEIRTLYFWDIKTEAELKVLGNRELRKFYYTGYTGSFVTFGLPSVKHGDEVVIIDNILPERDGSYLVKGVKKSFGVNGFRQEIELHLKLSVFTKEQIAQGL